MALRPPGPRRPTPTRRAGATPPSSPSTTTRAGPTPPTPRPATIPFPVTLNGGGSSDPDGAPLTYAWSFADGVQGSGPTLERTFVDDNLDMREAGGYLVTLSVSDGNGGTH